MEFNLEYKGNLSWLQDRTVFYTVHGSRAYGTHTPESDYDYKGIAIPPKEYFLGYMNVFEQAESKEPDSVIYDIRKIFNLAADNNPNVIEVLFTDESDHKIVTPIGRKILDKKEMFLSKKAYFTFSGYSISQMRKIETHFKWLKNPPQHPPIRSDFGLPEKSIIAKDQLMAVESAIKKQLEEWSTDFLGDLDNDSRIEIVNKMASSLSEMKISSEEKFNAAARMLGYSENFIELLDKERQYNSKKKEWDNFQEWKKNRNPIRAALEAKFGMDCKNAYHVVRLMRVCREILTTGKVNVKRPDREELLAIRNGAWTYEYLKEWATKQDEELKEIYKTSNILPKSSDRKKIDELCIELVEEMNFKNAIS